MIIIFEFGEKKIPVSLDPTKPFSFAIAQFRQKIGGITAHIDFRLKTGKPVMPTDTMKTLELSDRTTIVALLNEKEEKEAAYEVANPVQVLKQQVNRLDASIEVKPASPVNEKHQPQVGKSEAPLGKVTRLGPQGSKSEGEFSTDEEIEELTDGPCGIHVIKISGVYLKGYTRNSVQFGGVVVKEKPILTVAYPTQMAQCVASDDRLRTRSYDKNYSVESPLPGMDKQLFSRFVSIATIYGVPVKTEDEYGQQLALFSDISCLRHSCAPNAIWKRNMHHKPFLGIVKVAKYSGIEQGDEVTLLYRAAESVVFMLLPRDRRREILEREYHFTCRCGRCWKETALEATLTGAFFHGSAAHDQAAQRQLTNGMREEFLRLRLLDSDSGLMSAVNRQSLLPQLKQFYKSHHGDESLLELHPHHWRMSLVRLGTMLAISSMKETAAQHLDQLVFDMMLEQLKVESLFVPAGHPLSIRTMSLFKKFTALLPDHLAQSVQRKAMALQGVDWEALEAAERTW